MTTWKWLVHEPSGRFVYSRRGGADPEPRYDEVGVFRDVCWSPNGQPAPGYIMATFESSEKLDPRSVRFDATASERTRPATDPEMEEFDRAHAHGKSTPLYEERLVAFIDILGWSELIRRSAIDPELTRELAIGQAQLAFPSTSRSHLVEFFGEDAQRVPHVDAAQFSDCLVLSSPLNVWSASAFVSQTQATCTMLLHAGHYTRGAIVVGKIHHHENIVFGPALVETHSLERNVAKYPRLIVEPKARPLLEPPVKIDDKTETHLSCVRGDFDGLLYLDVLGFPATPATQARPLPQNAERLLEAARVRLVNDSEDQGRKAKHQWMINYLSAKIAEADR